MFVNRPGRGGFTLLELLVAMGMAAILTLVLFESLKAAMQARTSDERAVAPSRVAQVALEMMRQDLQNVPPISATSTVTTSTTATGSTAISALFEGYQNQDDRGHEGDTIDFYTLSDGQLIPLDQAVGNAPQGGSVVGSSSGFGSNGNWFPAGEMKFIEITIDIPPGMSDHCLVRRVWHNVAPLNLNLDPTQPANPDQEEVICRGVESFTVQYFDGTNWNDTWDSTQEDNQLPAAVQITLEMDRPVTVASDRNTPPLRYTQIIRLPCSNVATDTNITGTVSGLSGGFGQ